MTKFNYKRIVSYGCSFTAGSEITDHDIIGITEEELLLCARKNKYHGSHELYEHYNVSAETKRQILQSNRSKAWPAYIAQHYNIPLLNRGRPGSSLSHATYSLLRDIHSNTILPTDLILVGITSPNRWFQFTSSGREFYGVFGHGWTFLDHPHATTNYRKELENNWYNGYNVIYNHYKEMQFLSNLSNTMNGQIKLCYAIRPNNSIKHLAPTKPSANFIRKLFPSELSSDEEEVGDFKFIDFCNSLLSYENFLESETSLSDITGWKDTSRQYAFGHPRVEFHKEFADILIDRIDKLYD